MMIKVNGEYLDFNDDIEIESQIKLFEEIDSAQGDYSYSFEISKTNHNLKILGLPFPDTIKSIYQNVVCDLVDDSGHTVYTGILKVESITETISCSFFSGNNNWFGLLSNPISSLPLYKYDVDFTTANIQASWLNNSGIVFPIVDAGVLVTRSFANLKIEDFTSCFYVKTLFKEIFNPLGIKLTGDLIKDKTFNDLVVASNGRSQDEVRNRSSYVKKTTAQNNIGTNTKITFEDETTYPYFDGSQGNFASSTYTADVKMRIDTTIILEVDAMPGAGGSVFELLYYINGSIFTGFSYAVNDSGGTLNRTLQIPMEAGDYLEIRVNITAFNNLNVTGGNIKITPVYIYKVFGVSSVPNWTQGEFVSNILRLLNVLPSYNVASKTLTLDLFNNIKNKDYVDVSNDVTIDAIDFSELISNYAKNNKFSYQESQDEDLREYNISNFISYGSGNLTIENDFIENSADLINSDFTSPITYLNGVFDMSMERFNFVELEEISSKNITSVTDSSGTPRFNISNADNLFSVGDLVIIDTGADSDFEYNGEWVVKTVTSSYIEVNGPTYGTGADGTATLLRHVFTTDDNVYLFVNVPNEPNTFFSSKSEMMLEGSTTFTTSALAYFNLLSNGREINTKYKQSLSFGAVNNPLSYQMSILDTYWPIFSAILNDPVMLKVSAYFNKKTYSELKTFLRPLRVKTNETNNLYYLNRITGYKSGHQVCEAELIKL